MRSCFECGPSTLELRTVPIVTHCGDHEVTHCYTANVCTTCETWAIPALELERYELLGAAQVLRDHELNGAVAKDVRKVLGLGYDDLAARLGVTSDAVESWEASSPAPAWFQLALGGLVALELHSWPKLVELVYMARIYEDGDGWSVEFPDCPGCLTCGDSFDDARAMAKDALEGWLEVHVDDGDLPPKPAAREGEAILVNAELAARIAILWFPTA
jgi:predicted RNase H-like HicB family nuclease/DNA-binding transcriptional regulator YiaG